MGTAQARSCFAIAITVICVLTVSASPAGAKSRHSKIDIATMERVTATAKKSRPKKFKPVVKRAPLAVGDIAKTNETGFAEITYPDGSMSRLGADTKFTVTKLAKRGPIKTSLSQGAVWNEVVKATGGTTRFEVQSPNAIATVRGTAFAVTCFADLTCVFAVVEGTVDLTAGGQTVPVTAGQQATVDKGGINPVVPLVNTSFIQQNQDQDIAEQRRVPAIVGVAAGGSVSQPTSPTPKAIAAVMLTSYNEARARSGDPLANMTAVHCSASTKRLKARDIIHCTGTAGGKTLPYRVVVLDKTGRFGRTTPQRVYDIAKLDALLLQSSSGAAKLTSVTCDGGPFKRLSLPNSTITCRATDELGRSDSSVLSLDAGGTSQTTFFGSQ
jgi:hypothetical protein